MNPLLHSAEEACKRIRPLQAGLVQAPTGTLASREVIWFCPPVQTDFRTGPGELLPWAECYDAIFKLFLSHHPEESGKEALSLAIPCLPSGFEDRFDEEAAHTAISSALIAITGNPNITIRFVMGYNIKINRIYEVLIKNLPEEIAKKIELVRGPTLETINATAIVLPISNDYNFSMNGILNQSIFSVSQYTLQGAEQAVKATAAKKQAEDAAAAAAKKKADEETAAAAKKKAEEEKAAAAKKQADDAVAAAAKKKAEEAAAVAAKKKADEDAAAAAAAKNKAAQEAAKEKTRIAQERGDMRSDQGKGVPTFTLDEKRTVERWRGVQEPSTFSRAEEGKASVRRADSVPEALRGEPDKDIGNPVAGRLDDLDADRWEKEGESDIKHQPERKEQGPDANKTG